MASQFADWLAGTEFGSFAVPSMKAKSPYHPSMVVCINIGYRLYLGTPRIMNYVHTAL